MRIRDPCLRSETYSHPLLHDIEGLVDDHRDEHGCYISSEHFDEILARFEHQVTTDEYIMVCELSRSMFLEAEEAEQDNDEEDDEGGEDEEDEEDEGEEGEEDEEDEGEEDAGANKGGEDANDDEDDEELSKAFGICTGMDSRPFPSYRTILKALEWDPDMWTFYDPEVHAITQKLAASVLDKSKVLRAGMALTIHEVSFDEEGTNGFRTVLYVLKAVLPYRDTSSWQNSVQRAELWLRQQYLM